MKKRAGNPGENAPVVNKPDPQQRNPECKSLTPNQPRWVLLADRRAYPFPALLHFQQRIINGRDSRRRIERHQCCIE
jgi:hypothetical protein